MLAAPATPGLHAPDGDTVVITAGDDGNAVAWELGTGVTLETFKGAPPCCARGLAPVFGRLAAHTAPAVQYLVGCQSDRPFINVWAWGKVRAVRRARCGCHPPTAL
jgi:hypothetical protein